MAAKCIPIGFRFLPTDEELITHYLAEKIRGINPLPSNCIVEKQLYGENADPWNVFSSSDDQWVISDETSTDRRMAIYVFTKLTKISPKRISRTAGCGFWRQWRGQVPEDAVTNSRGDQIGSKRMLSFEGNSGFKIDRDRYGQWTMHEFSCTGGVNDNDDDDLNKNYYVVCRITTTWNNAKEYCRQATEDQDIAEISIPIGYRFSPTDEELVTHYLANKIQGKPLPWNSCIVEKQLYGENAEPWKVFSEQDPWVSEKTTDGVNKGTKTVKKDIYVFTKLTKLGSKRISRTAGHGVWRGETARRTPVKNSRGDQIGTKNMLSFQGIKSGFKIDENRYGHWIMHEFSCVSTSDDNNYYVVCKITASWNINNVMHSNKRPLTHQVEDDGILMNKKQKTTSDYDVLVQEDSSIALDIDEYNLDELMEIGYELEKLLSDDQDDHNRPM